MAISVTLCPEERRRPLPEWTQALGFGRLFTDHMFLMEYRMANGKIRGSTYKKSRALTLQPCAFITAGVLRGQKRYT
jgi:hypothetical protein